MKRILIIIALLLPVFAHAAWVKPLPREFTANEHCQPYQTFETPQAQIRIGWCHTDDTPPPGMWMWRLYVWQACLKAKCNTVPAGFSLVNAIDTVRAAPDPVAALASLGQQLRIPVVPGSAEEAHLLTVYSRACKAMTAPPYPGAPPQGWMPGWVFAADYCPNEPALQVETWRATGGTIFRYAAGRLTGVTGRKATAGTLCDGSTVRAVVGPTTYMAIAGGATTEATACLKS